MKSTVRVLYTPLDHKQVHNDVHFLARRFGIWPMKN